MDGTPHCYGECRCTEPASPVAPATQAGVGDGPVVRSLFAIPGMDCPAEEQRIRLRLADLPIVTLRFDLPGRRLTVEHGGDAAAVLDRLRPLGYGAELRETRPLEAIAAESAPATDAAQARVLRLLLGINAAMFAVELGAGWWAGSAGLIADAMDMFADAAVYTVALYAVGRDTRHQFTAARLSGVLQFLLAIGALTETVRHVLLGTEPVSHTMIGIASLALVANVACLLLISAHHHGGVHMKASYIFSANDVLANLGVIAAGLLVIWTASPWPDWASGGIIALLVLAGAVRILRLRG